MGNRKKPDFFEKDGKGDFWDFLSKEERMLVDAMSIDGEALLEEQIRLFAVRERRIMRSIGKYAARADEEEEDGDAAAAKRRERALTAMQRQESELTRVQRAKTQCIEALSKIRASQGEANPVAEDWLKGLEDGE